MFGAKMYAQLAAIRANFGPVFRSSVGALFDGFVPKLVVGRVRYAYGQKESKRCMNMSGGCWNSALPESRL